MEKKVEDVEEVIKEKTETDDTKKKAYHYVPSAVTTFQQFEEYTRTEEIADYLHSLMNVYLQIVENIMYNGQSQNPLFDIQNATLELMRRLQFNKNNTVNKSFEYSNDTIKLNKTVDGHMEWWGIPTNNVVDREGDIFTANSHRNYVKKLKNQDVAMPALYIWHITEPVGVTTHVDYDERGFLKARGIVYPQYEQLVKNLCESTENMGMSHGNEFKVLKFNDENPAWIEEYASHELTFLPVENAANLLTGFRLGDK